MRRTTVFKLSCCSDNHFHWFRHTRSGNDQRCDVPRFKTLAADSSAGEINGAARRHLLVDVHAAHRLLGSYLRRYFLQHTCTGLKTFFRLTATISCKLGIQSWAIAWFTAANAPRNCDAMKRAGNSKFLDWQQIAFHVSPLDGESNPILGHFIIEEVSW